MASCWDLLCPVDRQPACLHGVLGAVHIESAHKNSSRACPDLALSQILLSRNGDGVRYVVLHIRHVEDAAVVYVLDSCDHVVEKFTCCRNLCGVAWALTMNPTSGAQTLKRSCWVPIEILLGIE